MSNELTTKETSAVAVYDYGENATIGYEGTTRDDFKTPWIKVAQKNTPEVDTVEGLTPGMIFNSADPSQHWDQIPFVAATTQQVYMEWKPRGAGGGGGKGFVGVHQPDSQVVLAAIKANGGSKFGKLKTPAGNDLAQTFNVFGLALDPATLAPFACVTGFASTGIPHYQVWRGLADRQKYKNSRGEFAAYPLPAHVYRLTVVKEQNDKGIFFNLHFEFNGKDAADSRLPPDNGIFLAAVEVAKQFKRGELAVDHSKAGGSEPDDNAVPF